MNQNYKPENHLRPVELHHADISLEKDIKKILHNRKSGKKEKIKAPQGTARSILQCHLRSHVQYYLDSLPNPAKILLDFCSIATIFACAAYAAIRLVNAFSDWCYHMNLSIKQSSNFLGVITNNASLFCNYNRCFIFFIATKRISWGKALPNLK